jgi:hypothetical protein
MFLLTEDGRNDVVAPTPVIDMYEMMGLEEDGNNPAEKPYWIDMTGLQDDCVEIEGDNLRDREVFGDRKVLIQSWQDDVNRLRKALYQVTTREELYACVSFGAMIDEAMNLDPTWNRPFDSYERLERVFLATEERINKREMALKAEKMRLEAYTKSVYVMSFGKEVKVRDYQTVHS